MEHVIDIDEAQRARPRNNGATPNAIVLGPRDTLTGTLTVDGNVRVQGSLDGELRASGDVDVESTATVNATLDVANLTVHGTLTGEITVRRRLSVGGSGTVSGQVRCGRLQVDDGATVNGSITMDRES